MTHTVPERAAVGHTANAICPTDAPQPRCATPGCPLHAVVRATVELHFTAPPVRDGVRLPPPRSTGVFCLPCYARLRRLQAEASAEIVAAEAVR